jgi:hypothetical protein
MSDHILDGLDLTGMTFPTKSLESELWQQKVPNFCPRCEEIRGNTDGGTPMNNGPQTLAFKSFGMCTECCAFQRDHPAETQENQAVFHSNQTELKKKSEESFRAHRFRVWLYEPNEKLCNAPFAESVTNVKFTKYPVPTPHALGVANYTIPFLTEEDAAQIVIILTSKGLNCWYGEINQGV